MKHVSDACGPEPENIYFYIFLRSCPNSFLGVSNYIASGLNTPISNIGDSPDAIKSRTEAIFSLGVLQNAITRYYGFREYEQNCARALNAFFEAESKLAAAIIPETLKTFLCERIRNSKQDLLLMESSAPDMSPTLLIVYEKAVVTAVGVTYELMKSYIETYDGIGQQNDQVQGQHPQIHPRA